MSTVESLQSIVGYLRRHTREEVITLPFILFVLQEVLSLRWETLKVLVELLERNMSQ